MKKNNETGDLLKLLKVIISIAIVVMLLLPIFLNLLLYTSIPTANDLGNKEWLGFWGSYIGGCFGGLCTLITIYLTIHYYEKQENEHKTELAVQMEKHDEEMKNELLRKYRPILILHPNGGAGTKGKYNPFYLHVNNLSEYAAINVIIDGVYESKIDKGSEIVMSIKSTKPEGGYNDFLSVHVDDVVGNKYIWKYQLEKIEDVSRKDGTRTDRYYYKIVEETIK